MSEKGKRTTQKNGVFRILSDFILIHWQQLFPDTDCIKRVFLNHNNKWLLRDAGDQNTCFITDALSLKKCVRASHPPDPASVYQSEMGMVLVLLNGISGASPKKDGCAIPSTWIVISPCIRIWNPALIRSAFFAETGSKITFSPVVMSIFLISTWLSGLRFSSLRYVTSAEIFWNLTPKKIRVVNV